MLNLIETIDDTGAAGGCVHSERAEVLTVPSEPVSLGGTWLFSSSETAALAGAFDMEASQLAAVSGQGIQSQGFG